MLLLRSVVFHQDFNIQHNRQHVRILVSPIPPPGKQTRYLYLGKAGPEYSLECSSMNIDSSVSTVLFCISLLSLLILVLNGWFGDIETAELIHYSDFLPQAAAA